MSLKRILKSAGSELVEHKKTRIISLILIIVFGIVQFFINVSAYDIMDSFFVNYFLSAILLFVLFVVCRNIFKDMYDNTAADVQMSLPLSARERYFSHILAIGYVFEIPFIIITCFSNVITFFCSRYFYLENLKRSRLGFSDRFFWGGQFEPFFKVFLKYELILIAITLFVIAVTSFSISCIGAKSESVYIPMLIISIFAFIPVLIFGFITLRFIIFSPDLENIRLLKIIPGFMLYFEDVTKIKFLDIAANILLSVFILLLGLAAFEKRDVKTVGKPVVNKFFYEFLMFVLSITVFMLSYLGSNPGSFIVVNIIGIIGIIILRILGSRKEFRVVYLLKWIGIYLLYYVLFIIMMFAFCKTNMFGMASKCFTTDYDSPEWYCEIRTIHEEYDRGYLSFYRGYSYDDYYRENAKSCIGSDYELNIINLYSVDSKKLSKIFAKYNYISMNKPGYFADRMFFIYTERKIGLCGVNFKVFSDSGRYHYIDFNTLYLDKSEYDNLVSDLSALK